MARVLVVDDDAELAASLRARLEEELYAVSVVGDGEQAVALLAREPFDIVILDVLLPGMSGFEVCATMREASASVRVVMVTALGGLDDCVRGLDIGADDYLVKPFGMAELVARVHAVLRRRSAESGASGDGQERHGDETLHELGELRLDVAAGAAWRGDIELRLSARDLKLLEIFLCRPGIVLSRRTIAAALWAFGVSVPPGGADQCVAQLRHKVDGPPFDDSYIETLRGVGWRVRDPR